MPVENFTAIVNDFVRFQASVQGQCDAACVKTLHTGGRFVDADDIWLSPFYKRDTAVVSMVVYGTRTTQADPDVVYRYDQGLHHAALAYASRPHLGKNNYFSQHTMATAWNATFTPFVNLWRALDPNTKLVNAYLQLLFDTL